MLRYNAVSKTLLFINRILQENKGSPLSRRKSPAFLCFLLTNVYSEGKIVLYFSQSGNLSLRKEM